MEDTFKYIVSMDNVRSSLPEEHKPSWVKITTITIISKFTDDIDIPLMTKVFNAMKTIKIFVTPNSKGFEWTKKPTAFYNQITLGYIDQYSKKSIKLFPNGSIQVAGCSDLIDCKRIIRQVIFLVQSLTKTKNTIPDNNFRVVMINTNFSLNYSINLFKTTECFLKDSRFDTTFDPDRYSAVKIKFTPIENKKRVTASIFSSGKIIVTGAEQLEEIINAYNIINQHLLENSHVKVAKVIEPDVFGIILGYKISDWIKNLKEKGIKPWINF